MTTSNSTAQTAPITAEHPTNKVFELVDYLKQNEQKIKSWEASIKKFKNISSEKYLLKPKNNLEDDTAYRAKEREFYQHQKNLQQPALKDALDKLKTDVINFGFNSSDNGTYKNIIENEFDNWLININPHNREHENAKLTKCKANFYSLPHEAIDVLFWYLGNSLNTFYSDLQLILMGNSSYDGMFKRYGASKYKGIANDLSPYLSGATDEAIEFIIDFKTLPNGANKPKWKFKTDGWRFGKYVGLTNAELRGLFDNDIRGKNKAGAGTPDYITPILQKHKVMKAQE